MESHPLTKIFIGIIVMGIVAGAFWFGRTGGNLPVDDTTTSSTNTKKTPKSSKQDNFERPAISSTGPYPKAKLDEKQHDFSVTVIGSDGSHAFKIHNIGEAPLILAKGPTTCKCTISELATGEIPPGESATIDLAWKARVVTPTFKQVATIYTNDPEMEELELTVSGRITQLIEVAPQGRWYLEDISSSAKANVTGNVFSFVLDSLELALTEDSSDLLEVEFEPMSAERLKASGAKSGQLVRVSASKDVPVGQFREKLGIKVLQQEMEPIEVYVEGSRSGPISFLASRRTTWNPASMTIKLGNIDAKRGASAALLLFVRGLNDAELEFNSITTDPESLQVELKPDLEFEGTSRKKYELEFKLPPGIAAERRTGREAAVVEIKTNHPEAETLKFRLNYISQD